jgi:hypothetical protein
MKTLLRASAAAAVLLAGALATPVLAQPGPDARIYFHGTTVALLAGVSGGKGTLVYHGRRIPIDVSGLAVGEIGVNHYDVSGDVYHLHHLRDIEGTFAAVHASATAGLGAGAIDMQNGQGVEIHASSATAGLAAAIGPKGFQVRLEH